MPLIHVHVIRGRSDDELRTLLDVTHAAVVEAMAVPHSDRYQILSQHDPIEMVALDTGLGYRRTSDLVMIQVISKARTVEAKTDLYSILAEQLNTHCDIAPSDLILAITENRDADWSFGGGEAQFLTGAL